ncbi:PX domain-containing protein kinase-like protein isoform X1 [Patiria miniata]|uniref:PX domain-containing protein kinase-like protein n=1 Tax=Patiria miniata TaxID=46514 RepID=A0A913ZTK7_PATMI|nr:PX domain-containing protein kinase-like protein isoform X1 [Patiria miniata]
MSLFEKTKSSGKVLLDDTTPLQCVIEAAQNVETHIDYVMKVQRGIAAEKTWQINRRYSDFVALHEFLKITNLELPLPPKKVFGNMDREFIAERQQSLQQYLSLILSHHLLATSFIVKRFLDPSNYPANLQEVALQHVSMFFRSEPYWEVVEPFRDIGWRIRKSYFLIRPKDQPKVRQILAWSDFGPDKVMEDKDILQAMKVLPTIQHPYIYPVTFASANETGGFAIRTYHATGTLRDFICKAKPKHHYLRKYCHPKSYTAFNMMNIKTYGRQILEALKFLHEKGIPYGHLHTGNVILEGNTCRLLDVENSMLGLPSYYRDFIVQHKKINTTEQIDVYSFGHIIFEMVFGMPLNKHFKDDFPHTVPSPIKSVLESILTSESCKSGLPSVDDLIADPLFSDVSVASAPQFRLSSKLKEPLKMAKENGVEKRLKADQKQLASWRRASKAHAHHNSEEEKKKRKKASAKKRMSEQQLSVTDSQTNGATNGATNGTASGVSSPSSTAPSSPSSVPPPPQSPPPPVAPPPPGAPSQASPAPRPAPAGERGALLSSIQGFTKGALKKTDTKDCSGPRV